MDLKQLKDLFSDHDIEGLIAMHGAPLDEYDEEATKLTRRLKDLELDKTKIDHTAIVDALIGIWSESFNSEQRGVGEAPSKPDQVGSRGGKVMREVVIASSVRTAVGKSGKGTLRATRPDDLAAVAIKGALDRIPQLDKKEIEDVIIGCATPEAEQGMNVARIASLRAGLPVEVSAMTINRFCSSGLQAISLAVDSVAAGRAEVAIGGGTESMSMIPMGGNKVSINPWLMDNYPDSYLSMGLTAERLARRFGITRQQADEFSLNSHKKAIAAIQGGKFEDEIVPVPVSFTTPNGSKPKRMEIVFKVDEGPRAESTMEALAGAEAGFPCQGKRYGREFIANVGRRGGNCRHDE